jgi:hypothetical protein
MLGEDDRMVKNGDSINAEGRSILVLRRVY